MRNATLENPPLNTPLVTIETTKDDLLEEPPVEAPAHLAAELSVVPIPAEIIQPRPKQFGWAFWITLGVALTLAYLILTPALSKC